MPCATPSPSDVVDGVVGDGAPSLLRPPDLDELGLAGLPRFRRIPHNLEAEMAMLGCILVTGRKGCRQVFPRISGSSSLCLAAHRIIFDAAKKMYESGKNPDYVALKSAIDGPILDEVGGPGYLDRLVDCMVMPITAGQYAELIERLAVKRAHISVGEDLVSWGYAPVDYDDPTPADVYEQLEELRWAGRCSTIEGLEKYRFSDLHNVEAPPIEPLLGGWLHRQSRVFVSGAKKTGKSFLLIEIMRAVGTGQGLLHWAGNGKRTKVLYIDGELGIAEFQVRQKDFRTKYGDDLGDGIVMHFDCYPLPPIDEQAGQQIILNAALQIGAGLVIIDNWTALTKKTLSEDVSVKDIRPLINELMARRIASICGLHAGHDVTRPVGSYVIGALTTGTLHLTRDEGIPANECRGEVTWQDTRSARPNDPDYRSFRYAVADGVVVEADEGMCRRKMPEKQHLRWALEQLDQCLFHHGQVLTASAVRPNGMSAVQTKTFREWLMRRGETTEIECQRTIKDLIVGGWVCKDGDWIWRV